MREMEFVESDWSALIWAIGSMKCIAVSTVGGSMRAEKINRLSVAVVIVLSAIAFVTVLTGYLQAPQPDEGAGAHIFQLSIAARFPVLVVFLATADWKKPVQIARLLVAPVVTLVLAFGALYYLEHYYYIQHYR